MVDGFSCILDFVKFPGGGTPDPLYKGNTSIKPQNLSSTTTAAKRRKTSQKAFPIKIYKKCIFRLYKNWKEEGAGARSFLCDV